MYLNASNTYILPEILILILYELSSIINVNCGVQRVPLMQEKWSKFTAARHKPVIKIEVYKQYF